MLKSINPYHGNIVHVYPEHRPEEISRIVNEVHLAHRDWAEMNISLRAEKLRSVAELLRKDKLHYARLITEEMGKIIREAEAEIEKSAWVCEFYADHAHEMLREETVISDASKSFVTFEPLGVILAIMPWNFPFWQVFRFAAPALMAGNTVVLKHASNVPGCAMAIEKIFRDAGFPENCFRTLLIRSDQVQSVIAHEFIRGVTLTGSENAGREVAKIAGMHLKKTVLELGGSDPFIVLNDADLEKCVENAVSARMVNTGQSCIAAKRFIIVQQVQEEFTEMLKKRVLQLKAGDPLEYTTDYGPLARPDLLDELKNQVARSVQLGASVILGGKPSSWEENVYEPTILTDVTDEMPVFREETFGPVFALMAVEDELAAIRCANNSRFGLGASIWTGDVEKGLQLAKRIEAGMVFINGMVKSDPRLPFGGIKHSGYGRELSLFGIREFMNIKTIWVG